MELLDHNLTEIKFKTLHNQFFDYADIFLNKRVLIFSLPKALTTPAWYQLKGFTDNYNTLINLGIDQIYCVSSEPLIIPHTETHSPVVIPLLDNTLGFVKFLPYPDIEITEVSKLWQYTVIINNGIIEKLFSNPIKKNLSLKVYCFNHRYQYHNVDAKTIIDYLDTNR
jgi:peroxiredoxin